MPASTFREIVAVVMTCLLGLLCIFSANLVLRGRITSNAQMAATAPLLAALPDDIRTKAALIESGELDNTDKLHLRQPAPYFQIVVSGQPIGWLLPVVADEGYGGDIELMVALRMDGRVLGVNVLSQHETIGLGSRIERSHSQWLDIFNDRSLKNPSIGSWFVRKDGGELDGMTGATVTSRAATKAIKQALEFYAGEGLQKPSTPLASPTTQKKNGARDE
jgi:electron transport complex protein RnfG